MGRKELLGEWLSGLYNPLKVVCFDFVRAVQRRTTSRTSDYVCFDYSARATGVLMTRDGGAYFDYTINRIESNNLEKGFCGGGVGIFVEILVPGDQHLLEALCAEAFRCVSSENTDPGVLEQLLVPGRNRSKHCVILEENSTHGSRIRSRSGGWVSKPQDEREWL